MIYSRRKNNPGFTLVEVLTTVVIFSIALTVLAMALTSSKNILNETTSSSDAAQSLRKLYINLETDLHCTSFQESETNPSLVGSGAGLTGDAIWFLSAVDPATGQVARASNGTPLWQRNVLYYTAVPTNHAALYGFNCAGGANADGYDVHCPHKVLIRKVIDFGTPTTPTNEASQELLIPAGSIAAYLTPPTGFNVPLTNPGEEEGQVLISQLLTFRAQRGPGALPTEIHIEAKCTSLKELGKKTAVGSTNLENAPETESIEFSIFPQNP